MWNIKRIKHELSARGPGPARMVGGIWHAVVVLDLALEVRRERRILLSMDEHTLKDIGLSRSVACAEGRRWFWDIPADRLRLRT
jgi:uncharacterized protein YjiS (DUF1127 family)